MFYYAYADIIINTNESRNVGFVLEVAQGIQQHVAHNTGITFLESKHCKCVLQTNSKKYIEELYK